MFGSIISSIFGGGGGSSSSKAEKAPAADPLIARLDLQFQQALFAGNMRAALDAQNRASAPAGMGAMFTPAVVAVGAAAVLLLVTRK